MSFETLGDKDNAIALCPTCHRNYDNFLGPGPLFIPTDLDFFINFERRDQERRREQMVDTQSPPPARVPPAPEVYREYQLQQGLIGAEDIGGLYNCYILKEYLPRFTSQSTVGLTPFFKGPRPWHGSPTATIHRATNLIAKLHNKVSPDIFDDLFTLSKLYAEKIEWQPTLASKDRRTDPGNGGEGPCGAKDVSGQHQPGTSHSTGPSSTGNPHGLAVRDWTTDGQSKHLVELGEDFESTRKPSLEGKGGKTEQKGPSRSKRQRLDVEAVTWGPSSTSADAISVFTDIYNFPYTPPEFC